MKLYESCLDYKRDAEDVLNENVICENWITEFNYLKKIYDPNKDFMEQLSNHNLFRLLCILDLNCDDYIDKCYEIKSNLED
jgi:hypothetical protein